MKTITMLSFLLLFALYSQPLLGSAKPSLGRVLDISGKKLRVDADYYIIPANGGDIVVQNTDETCPLHVVVVKHGELLPLRLAPIKGDIRVSTDLNIMLANYDSRCPGHSIVWKIDPFSKEETFVTTGGDLGHPGSKTINSWFKIEKYEDAYKLVYCPNVCPSCKHVCKDIGNYVYKNGEMRLALTKVPYKVMFQEA